MKQLSGLLCALLVGWILGAVGTSKEFHISERVFFGKLTKGFDNLETQQQEKKLRPGETAEYPDKLHVTQGVPAVYSGVHAFLPAEKDKLDRRRSGYLARRDFSSPDSYKVSTANCRKDLLTPATDRHRSFRAATGISNAARPQISGTKAPAS